MQYGGRCGGGTAPSATNKFGRAEGTRPNLFSPQTQKIHILRHVSSPSLSTFGNPQQHGWKILIVTNYFQSALFYVQPFGADLSPIGNWLRNQSWVSNWNHKELTIAIADTDVIVMHELFFKFQSTNNTLRGNKYYRGRAPSGHPDICHSSRWYMGLEGCPIMVKAGECMYLVMCLHVWAHSHIR